MLHIHQISYSYPDGHKALSSLSLEIAQWESVGLVGANGAGKSTFLYMMPGVLLPTEGKITIDGIVLDQRTAPTVRQKVGLVFQDSDDQLFCSSVYEDIAFGPRNMGLSEEDVALAVEHALEITGIASLANRAPYKLSGGEKKMAAIASVLSMQPKLLVMDEPSASLDPKARRKLIILLKELPQTKIIASHDLDLVWDVCSRVVILKEGKIAADGPVKDILTDEKLLDTCGLELPLRFTER